jgi:dTDP-glucose pyrophosphorylase
MKCVVPLAGPDLWSERYGLRPLVEVDGEPLIEAALRPRAWAGAMLPRDYVFVVRETRGLSDLVAYLRQNWPSCRIVTLSDLSGGALFSTLSAMALITPDEPVVIDLADILFSGGPNDPQDLFARDGHGAIIPTFPSDEPCYSYLKVADGLVVEAREKQVISNNASAGVYMFRSMQIFLAAAVHSITHRDTLSVNGNLFVCPMVNGVIAAGHTVIAPDIGEHRPVGKMFHASA